jgi:hypothetical protein
MPLPGGSELRTLRGAGNYIAKLPKKDHAGGAVRVIWPAAGLNTSAFEGQAGLLLSI